MADQWFYRMFGEDFGPMPLEKLQELAGSGTVQALDLVRAESSSEWVAAATIDELGLSTSERRTSTSVAVKPASDAEMTTQAASDDWYCQLGGQELGPLSFDELLKYAEHEQLGADDQVKLGPKGKWRRVGSIGRLMAALPYQAVEKSIVVARASTRVDRTTEKPVVSKAAITTTPVVAAPDTAATYRVAYEQAKAKLTESMLAQADAAFKAAEEQAQAQIAWATAPNVDRYWWGWANGVEFGPVEFTQVFGLAKSGQLKASDFVRNGTHGQFVPSSNVPGLYRALDIIARATETRNLAKSQAQAAAALALPPMTAPTQLINAAEQQGASNASIAIPHVAAPTSNPAIEITKPAARPASDPQVTTRKSDPQIATPAAAVEPTPAPPVEAPRPAPSLAYSSSNYGASSSMSGFSSSSSSMSTYGTSRPVTPPKSYPKRTSRPSSPWLSDMLENLKEPKALGAIGTIALVMLIVGWSYLPKNRSADLKQYNAMKMLVDEIKAKRTTAPAELPKIEQLLTKLSKEIAVNLKDKASRDDPAKQCLLWAARDEVPRFIQAGLAMESPAEKSLEARLREAAYELGLEKRPPVDLAQLAARANDD